MRRADFDHPLGRAERVDPFRANPALRAAQLRQRQIRLETQLNQPRKILFRIGQTHGHMQPLVGVSRLLRGGAARPPDERAAERENDDRRRSDQPPPKPPLRPHGAHSIQLPNSSLTPAPKLRHPRPPSVTPTQNKLRHPSAPLDSSPPRSRAPSHPREASSVTPTRSQLRHTRAKPAPSYPRSPRVSRRAERQVPPLLPSSPRKTSSRTPTLTPPYPRSRAPSHPREASSVTPARSQLRHTRARRGYLAAPSTQPRPPPRL